MSSNKCNGVRKGKLFVISGPSGSGKSTLAKRAVAQTKMELSISATTRAPGANEVEGKDYYFLSEEDFLRKVEAGEFLEYAQVFDNYYGTPTKPVQEKLVQGKGVVLEIDVQGAQQVFGKLSAGQAEGILILPPNEKELRRRLQGRGRDDELTINKRLAKAQWEIAQARTSGNYQHTIVNNDLDKATEQLITILKSE